MASMRSWLLVCALLVSPSALAQDDTEGPVIDHEPVGMTVSGKPLLIVATITDANGVFEPAVLYRIGGEGTFVSVPMEAAGEGNAYTATIPGDIVVAEVEYFIEAFDELGNGPSREGDPDLPLAVRVVARDVEQLPPDDDGPTTGGDSGEGGDDGGEAEEGSSLPLILGVGGAAGGAAIVAVAAAAAGGAAAYYFLVLNGGNNTPSQVTVTVSSPSPTGAALTAGAP